MKRIFFCLILLVVFFTFVFKINADEIEDLGRDIQNLNRALEMSRKATTPLEADVVKLTAQLDNIIYRVNILEKEIVKKEKEVKQQETVFVYQKKLLEERTKSYYKNIYKNTNSMIELLVAENLSGTLQNFFYQKHLMDEDKNTIIKIVLYIRNLEERKANLEEEKVRMALLKKEIDKQAVFLKGEIAKAKNYQAELATKIAQLSAKQQSLIAQKLAALNISRSAGSRASACADDRSIDPGFSPRIAFFTYGVPNRVGMNQYGAKGRADRGDNYETILRAYYNFDSFQDFDANINVNNGNGINQGDIIWSGSLEDYVKRIYEMPGDWSLEALKAQAIAARSYVLAATNNGANSICANEYCQAFQTNPKGGGWEQATNETAKKAMVKGGSPIKSWYSSTHGGYIFSSGEIGWNSTDWTKHGSDFDGSVGSFDDLKNKAFDSESPWFYCDWGYRAAYNKTAWLKPEELADIVNVLLLAKRDSSVQEHLYQTDSPPSGTDTWGAEKVKSELRSRGGNPFNNISDVSVSVDFGSGRTTTINVSGDAGAQSFDGSEFKNFFNLRAPANIQIVGPLYNAEKR